MNDRVIVRRLKKSYPLVHMAIAPDPVVKDLTLMPEYFARYCGNIGLSHDKVAGCQEQRTRCIAVMVLLVDPLFFKYTGSPTYRFQKEMTKLLRCNNGQIFYNLRKSRNFMKVYPEFRHEIERIFAEITKE